MFGEGDLVANYWHMEGVHTGDFLGIPATGKVIDFRGLAIGTFKEGKLVEEWEFTDELSVFRQLGLIESDQDFLMVCKNGVK